MPTRPKTGTCAWWEFSAGARHWHAQGTIEALLGKSLPLGTLDITLYRDDLSREHPEPKLNRTDIAFSVEGKTVVMVDDVLYTGRTARSSAMDAIDFARTAGQNTACRPH